MPMIAKQAAKVIPLVVAPKPIAPARQHVIPKWIFWVSLAALLAAAGWYWRTHSQNKIGFETLPLERGSIQSNITATGTLNPVVNVQVSSQVSGNIQALYANFNTRVKKGQLVALIDPQIFQAQVDQASAAAAALGAAVVTAQAQYEKANSDLEAILANRTNLEALAARDQANAANAESQWKRSELLYRQGIASQQDHDTARATYEASQAQVAADQAQIAVADHTAQSGRAQVDAALQQLNVARNQHRQSEAALAQATINLGHTRILAPVSGIVIARHFDVGQTVAASFQAPDIFDIAQDLTKMQVDTNVDESDVGTIQTGQSATFTVDAYPGTTFRGLVTDVRKSPVTQQNVVTYDVVINVANPDIKLFPGMTANVSILTARQDDVLKAPNAALRFHPTADLLKQAGGSSSKAGGQQIYVLSGGKLTAVPVKVGISDGRSTAITAAGLRPGDAIVVRASSPTTSSTSTAPNTPQRMPRM